MGRRECGRARERGGRGAGRACRDLKSGLRDAMQACGRPDAGPVARERCGLNRPAQPATRRRRFRRASMEYVNLGATGLKVSRICLGCMSYGAQRARHASLGARRGGEPAVLPPGARSRHQLLRHGERLFARRERGDHRPRAEGLRQARRDRARHQGARQDARRPERQGPVAQGDHERDRRQPEAARHRLCRSLPDPPLGPGDADRGDARGAERRREGRQGALYRRLLACGRGSS